MPNAAAAALDATAASGHDDGGVPTVSQPQMTALALSLVKPERSSKCGLRLQSVENGAVTVLATTPGGLAAAAGLLPGDELKQVASIMVLSGDQVGRLLGQAVGAVPILVSRSTVWPEEEPPAATPAPDNSFPNTTPLPSTPPTGGPPDSSRVEAKEPV